MHHSYSRTTYITRITWTVEIQRCTLSYINCKESSTAKPIENEGAPKVFILLWLFPSTCRLLIKKKCF
jgi:hypothetical protein